MNVLDCLQQLLIAVKCW